jgi:hypothetical protein
MSKHTPGPWYESSTGNNQGLVISESTSANVAVTYDKKDAALITAAPDLLVALQVLLNATMRKNHPAESDLAMAAITKATGEST